MRAILKIFEGLNAQLFQMDFVQALFAYKNAELLESEFFGCNNTFLYFFGVLVLGRRLLFESIPAFQIHLNVCFGQHRRYVTVP